MFEIPDGQYERKKTLTELIQQYYNPFRIIGEIVYSIPVWKGLLRLDFAVSVNCPDLPL
jgi:hypothetical protein